MYIKAFIEIYNWCAKGLVYKTHRIVKLEKYLISKVENFLNLGSQQFYKLFKVLQNAHVISKDTEGNTFYHNNYIDWDQFNQLYKSKWQTKGIQSVNAIIQKLMLASKKTIEQRQEAEIRAMQMKRPRKIDNDSLDPHRHNYHDTNESQDSQSNGEVNLDEIKDLNIC